MDILENFVGDFETITKPSFLCVKDGLLSEIHINYDIIIKAKIGNVELKDLKIHRSHKLSAEEVVKILSDDNNLELGVFFERPAS